MIAELKSQSERKETLCPYPIKACLLDLDGLLVNTQKWWDKAVGTVLSAYGINLTDSDLLDLAGRGRLSTYLLSKFSLPVKQPILRDRIRETFWTLAEAGIEPMPGAIELVKNLSQSLLLAVASGNTTEYVERIITRLGLKENFKALVGNDQVEHGKPAPDILIKSASLLGVKPQECLVLEDAQNGIEAAYAADMRSIAVNPSLSPANFPKATLFLPSLILITLTTIADLEKVSPPTHKVTNS